MDHALRRERLAAALVELDIGVLVVTTLPNVRYLTGFSGSNAQLVLGRQDALFLTDGRYEERSRREVSELERRIYLDGRWAHLARACAELGGERIGFEREGLTYGEHSRLLEALGTGAAVPIGGAVEALRAVKDPAEVERLGQAQEVTDLAFEQAVLGGLRDGITERELALDLEVALRHAGADDKGFDAIVAFGENAAEPHHEPSDRPLAQGDVVKVDFGARVDGYHSDMTRTVAFGEPDQTLRDVHGVVAAAQRAGMDAVRGGASLREVDGAARGVIERAGFGERFPHGLGHGVGLEIHEEPFLRWNQPEGALLAAGAVITIEPGIYWPGLGGIRIEDMVEVTEEGGRVLGRSTRELVVL